MRSLAGVSVRVRRNASACALPRPSATASAKFANRIVNHSHRMICNSKPMFGPPVRRSRIKITVVRRVTTSSTNMTGLLISVRGSSFTKADPIAGTTILRSKSAEAGVVRVIALSIWRTPYPSEQRMRAHRQLLDDRAERKCGEIDQSAGDQDHADEQADEQAAMGGEGAGGRRHSFLFDQ